MPTIIHGEKQGLGCADLKWIKLSGLDLAELSTVQLTDVNTVDTRPENLYNKTTRLINKTVLRPRPTIVSASCTDCGDCQLICPVDAIFPAPSETFRINMLACVHCHLCAG